jgi:membrane-bound serine protease (ClpP class)
MKTWVSARCLIAGLALLHALPELQAQTNASAVPRKVFILPVREDIMPPLVYLIRRGVKEAIEQHADLLVLDMETNGGRLDVTEDIIKILDEFKGQTVTYVNRNAFSAGAFIAVATQKIYMSPQSVIGAAAPIVMSPEGGVQDMPKTMEAKTVSAVSALVRTRAEKNGYNKEVVQAMIDKTKELKLDGKVLNKEGQILTLTNKEAEEKYGDPPAPLLSSGTVESIDTLLALLGYRGAERHEIKPTGVETLGFWINAISPLLLVIGIIGVYIEFKTPGFGLPGIVGIVAFALYFFGGYVAGLSGLEWLALFIVGMVLFALELFVFPGTVFLGLGGAILMLVALVMALADVYPATPSVPGSLPSLPRVVNLGDSLQNLAIALGGALVVGLLLSRFLPKTSFYRTLVSQSASGEVSVADRAQQQALRIGEVGVAISSLRPGGKAQFGDSILDVMSQGDMLPKGAKVRIIAFSGTEAVVEKVEG